MRGWMGAALGCLALGAAPPAFAQDFGRIASEALHQRLPGDSQNLSKRDLVAGLKEALTTGTKAASRRIGVRDGYYGDAGIRVPLPGVLADAQKRLKPFGMSGPLDDLHLRMNRAAEATAPTAQKLVLEAIRTMTVEDALGLLRGADMSATEFLRRKTEVNLAAAFRPYVEAALADAGALVALDTAVAKYGAGLVQKDAKGWLTDHAVAGALNGLFYYVALEEQAIRRDPASRTSDLLKRVFGG
ncbi:MAG: DUF4197 domain-containing protein [Alphaproteobacteria bacterium]|nr:DUF4197 domain-containing protein [Alphaproteobacteria bacterium]